MGKFKVGDKVRVRNDLNIGESYRGVTFVGPMKEYKGKIFEIKDIEDEDVIFLKDISFAWVYEMLEKVNVYETEKSFKEVIADIKEGEIWESEFKTIRKVERMILIDEKKNIKISTFAFDDDTKFKLKRKKYTFQEAFKALEEGKEIESCATKTRFKVIDEELKVLNSNAPKLVFYYFSYKEIKNNWYIN